MRVKKIASRVGSGYKEIGSGRVGSILKSRGGGGIEKCVNFQVI